MTATKTPTAPVAFVFPESVDRLPRPIEQIQPIYPDQALKERVRGVVLLRALVSESGTPLRVEVVKGVRADVDAAAVEAALQWRFEPAIKNGRPVRTFATIRFSFEGIQFARTPFPSNPSANPRSPTPTP